MRLRMPLYDMAHAIVKRRVIMKKFFMFLLIFLIALNMFILSSCSQGKASSTDEKHNAQTGEVSATKGSNPTNNSVIDSFEYEAGYFHNKNWADTVGTYIGPAVPDKETALYIAQAVFNGMGRNNEENQFDSGSIFYDESDEIWIVTFFPSSNQLPEGVVIAGGGYSIAIQKSDGKILRIWSGE